MQTRTLGDKPRRACTACDYIHFTDPKVGVGVFVMNDQQELLLVRRVMEPGRGLWSTPAGLLDHGEDPVATAERETKEETGLDVAVVALLDVVHNPPGQGGASIFIMYRAELLGGTLQAGDDADDAGFFALDALPELAFESTQGVLGRLNLGRDTPSTQ